MHSQLSETLSYALRNIPFYKEQYLGYKSRLECFPLVTKRMIKIEYERFISDEFSELREELALFLKSDIRVCQTRFTETNFFHDVFIEETSGTSGVPFRCIKTKAERIRIGLTSWRQRRALDPTVSNHKMYSYVHTGQALRRFDVMDTRVSNLEALYRYIDYGEYTWIHSPPFLLAHHLDVLKQNIPSFTHLKFIECNGHFLNDDVRKRLNRTFGATVVDLYGLVETWAVALSCQHGVHHVNDQNIHIEILNDNDLPITDYYQIGRIVVTSLHLRLCPLIRYVTGDYGCFIPKSCACSLGTVAIQIEEGRESSAIKGCEENIYGNNIFKLASTKVRHQIDCYGLDELYIVQISLSNFKVYTNSFSNADTYIKHLENVAGELIGRRIFLEHHILDQESISAFRLLKPSLFRCEI